MKQTTLKRLVAYALFLLLALCFSILWLSSDIVIGRGLEFRLKLTAVLAASLLFAFLSAEFEVRSWSRRARLMQEFVAAMPAAEGTLPEDGPGEMQGLARALRSMAQHVRQIVDRTNLESSRREAILACMAEGVLAVDGDLKVIFCNDAFAQSFGTRASMAEGRTLYEVVREPALRDILQRALTTGEPEKDRLRLPTAGSRTFEARALPLGARSRRGAVIVLHDVTDIEHQEQVRKDFVADVSHELRTPLSAIRGFAETLLDGALEDSEHSRKFVEIILSQAIRLGNIASDLLVLSELDINSGPLADPQRVPVHEVIESAVNTVEKAASMRGIQLTHEDCQECFVSGLRFRLEQVLVNLLDNAVKFNREKGEVNVECKRQGEEVKIVVSDTGLGIPSGDLNRVFERFYRVDKARSRPAGGTGLGLPIVKEVVHRMGGTVSVESVLGRGSKFTVILKGA